MKISDLRKGVTPPLVQNNVCSVFDKPSFVLETPAFSIAFALCSQVLKQLPFMLFVSPDMLIYPLC